MRGIVVLVALALLLAACEAPGTASPTPDRAGTATAVTLRIRAEATLTASAGRKRAPTPTPIPVRRAEQWATETAAAYWDNRAATAEQQEYDAIGNERSTAEAGIATMHAEADDYYWEQTAVARESTEEAMALVPVAPVSGGQGMSDCDPAYPDFCIPSLALVGDLDCEDIDGSWFTVYDPDPHGFDGDFDGVGCEAS